MSICVLPLTSSNEPNQDLQSVIIIPTHVNHWKVFLSAQRGRPDRANDRDSGSTPYRVQKVSGLGWVDLDLECSIILLGQ